MSCRSFKFIKLVRAVYRQNDISLFVTVFRHVALLVTEISHQDQNFWNITRVIIYTSIDKNKIFRFVGLTYFLGTCIYDKGIISRASQIYIRIN